MVGVCIEKTSIQIYDDPSRRTNYRGTDAFLSIILSLLGVGTIILPKAIDQTNEYGFLSLFLLYLLIVYASQRLAQSWVILEERFPELRRPNREPYLQIAEKTLGKVGRCFVFLVMILADLGSVIVSLITLGALLDRAFDSLSFCSWLTIVGVAFIPLSWVAGVKDFKIITLLSVILSIIALILIIVQNIRDSVDRGGPVVHSSISVLPFLDAQASFVFSYSLSSTLSTIQNEIKNRTDMYFYLHISYFIGFVIMTVFGAISYIYQGFDTVKENVLLSLSPTTITYVAIIIKSLSILGATYYSFIPISLTMEKMANRSSNFNPKEVLFRTSIVFLMLFLSLAMPSLALVISVFGGATLTLTSIVFPLIFYFRLIQDEPLNKFHKRKMSIFEKIFIIFVCIVGSVFAVENVILSIISLSKSSFGTSCFSDFFQRANE